MIWAFCGVPLVTMMVAGPPGVLVKAKPAGVAPPATEAVTVKPPVVELAVKTAEVATPDAFVTAVTDPLAKLPEGPLPGAEKVTVTPDTGWPSISLTKTTRGLAKAVPTMVV